MGVRTAPAIVAGLLALGLGAAAQPRGGGRGGIPPLAPGLPRAGVRPIGRGFFPRARFGYRRGFWPWYGVGYADFEEPYFEEPPRPQVNVADEERDHTPASVMQPKLIELPASVEKTPPRPALPTVLVWRNGQREEVKEYAIAGSFLYDYTKPRASRRIPLDDLDLDATASANQQRGVQFLIPAGPSEVTVRF